MGAARIFYFPRSSLVTIYEIETTRNELATDTRFCLDFVEIASLVKYSLARNTRAKTHAGRALDRAKRPREGKKLAEKRKIRYVCQ